MTVALKLADAGRADLDDIVDLKLYPIHAPESRRMQDVLSKVHEELAGVGCSVLPRFLRPEALRRANEEGNALAVKAFYSHGSVNAYFTADDPNLPSDDPRRHFMERTSGFVTRDMIPPDAVAHRLYVSPAMKDFIARCVSEEKVYEYADPFAGLVVNALPEGAEQPWHYDTNEFITTVMTQEPESGGVFEYCPNIRAAGDENLGDVGRVLRGENHERVRRLDLCPGDLQIFKGRFALHRVTRVSGPRERHTAILAYSKEPGVIGRVERTRQLYGRVSEAHIEAEKSHSRADGLVD